MRPPAAFWGRIEAVWGGSGGPGAPSWRCLGGLACLPGAVMGASCGVVERRDAENAKTRKSVKNLRKINYLCLSWPSRAASRSSLGASWSPLGLCIGCLGPIFGHVGASGPSWSALRRPAPARGPILSLSWGLLGPCGAPLKQFSGSLGPSWGSVGASLAVLGRSWGRLRPSWSVGSSKT